MDSYAGGENLKFLVFIVDKVTDLREDFSLPKKKKKDCGSEA